jgi:hypothetical protein
MLPRLQLLQTLNQGPTALRFQARGRPAGLLALRRLDYGKNAAQLLAGAIKTVFDRLG